MTIQRVIERLRREYSGEPLDESSAQRDPVLQFEKWMEDAFKAEVPDPHAMALATVSTDGKPSVRFVLLRGFDHSGLVFFTNYESRKVMELLASPEVAVTFFWHELDRQVRVEGSAKKMSATESDAYFKSRPRSSQIASWASSQSSEIASRDELERRFGEFEKRFSGIDVPRPGNWGGVRIRPNSFEFWQGRPNRLHDRLLYTVTGSGDWNISRLAP